MTRAERLIRGLYLVDGKSTTEIAVQLNVSLQAIEEIVKKFKERPQSNIEKTTGHLLKIIYPKYKIYSQYNIENLFFDYYIEKLRLAIEVDGIQHTAIIPFFHGKSQIGQRVKFEHQIHNDGKKESAAKQKFIYIIRINYTEELTLDNIRRILNEHNNAIMDNMAAYNAANRLLK
jgi:predicted DNA-binding protein YlxM (UPF0122 family)